MKRQHVVLSEFWAQRLLDRGVVVHAVHPGWVETPGLARFSPAFRAAACGRAHLRDPRRRSGHDNLARGAPDSLGSAGRFWHDRRSRPTTTASLHPRTHRRRGSGRGNIIAKRSRDTRTSA